jgi:hypothetical protein
MHHGARNPAGGALHDDRLGADFTGDLLGRAANTAAEYVRIIDGVGFYIAFQRVKFAVDLRFGTDRVKRADALQRIFAGWSESSVTKLSSLIGVKAPPS